MERIEAYIGSFCSAKKIVQDRKILGMWPISGGNGQNAKTKATLGQLIRLLAIVSFPYVASFLPSVVTINFLIINVSLIMT